MPTSLGKLLGRLSRDSESGSRQTDRAQVLEDLRKNPRRSAGVTSRVEWLNDEGACCSKPITIRDLSPDGISFFAQETFLPHQTVWIETGANEMTRVVVRHCEQRGTLYVIGAQLMAQERRREDRSPVSGEGRLRWQDPEGRFRDTPVRVSNASDCGMQLESSVAVPMGTLVELTGDRMQCDGSICYCRESGDQFVIGVEINATFFGKTPG